MYQYDAKVAFIVTDDKWMISIEVESEGVSSNITCTEDIISQAEHLHWIINDYRSEEVRKKDLNEWMNEITNKKQQ